MTHPAGQISETDIAQVQTRWGQRIEQISAMRLANEPFDVLHSAAARAIDELYAFDLGPVLFKPTRAQAVPFRPTRAGAISYFVGGGIPEDAGFALQPWSAVRFQNHQLLVLPDSALAMGHYVFTEARTQRSTTAEYTFGYRLDEHGQLRIHLHHSSMPFASRPHRADAAHIPK